MLTVLHLLNSPASTFKASMTISPAITALVVAMAGMMLPAMAEGKGRVEGGGHDQGTWSRDCWLTFDVKSALLLDVEGKCSQVCRRCHKVHRNSVVLWKHWC